MGPFLKSKNRTDKIMFNLLIALTPIIIFSIYKNGYIPFINNKVGLLGLIRPLISIVIGAFTSFIVEIIYFMFKKNTREIINSYSIFPGLFLALILPLNTPLYILIIGSIIASLSKIISGGFGKNIFNPALIGYIFIVFFASSIFSTKLYFNNYEIDTISTSTPLTNASMLSDVGSYDKLVKPYGNLLNFFIGKIPGSLAETSSLLCILALIYLSITKTIKWRIPVTYILTMFLITFGIGRLLGQGIYYPLFHLFSGGLMFGAIFMATDPVTSAVSPIGQVLQGICLGILTVIFRFIGVEGVAFSILILNIIVFLFDMIGLKSRFNFKISIPWFALVSIVVIILIIWLASTKRVIGNKDPNFNIISKNKEGSTISYVVTQKGYGGNIKAEVIIENDKIKSVEIIKNNETKDRYQLIVDNNYINTLINNQDDIESVDTISGATVTSTALKKMLANVLNDYK